MTTSCQVTGIEKDIWMKFRQRCIEEGISANCKVRMLIEQAVSCDSGGGVFDNHCRCLNEKAIVSMSVKEETE